MADGEKIKAGKQLNEGSVYPHELLAIRGRTETEQYLVKEVQEVYKSQGVDINDKHIELIVRQMLKKVRVDQKGDTDYLPGQFVDRFEFAKANEAVDQAGGEAAQFEDIILGITKASLNTDSFLSAASFQETTKVLTDAALEGKIDRLNGLKENVIIGKLIPAATGSSATGGSRSSPRSRCRERSTTSACSTRTRSPRSSASSATASAVATARSSTPTSRRWRRSARAAPTPASPRSWPSSSCPRRTSARHSQIR